ncbi:hypothetical protein, partial [Rhizobium sp. AQ_MP]|uniref:hypothetical protein n=1 Tax=Rhizobium sp. AQ_MP TaxID=2761536 RepID=UPI001AEF14B4
HGNRQASQCPQHRDRETRKASNAEQLGRIAGIDLAPHFSGLIYNLPLPKPKRTPLRTTIAISRNNTLIDRPVIFRTIR